jgi:signal recognition particle receptor subunit beta
MKSAKVILIDVVHAGETHFVRTKIEKIYGAIPTLNLNSNG